MLSAENQAVYDALFALAGDSEGYKIIDADEVVEKLPSNMSFTKVQLSQIIRDLKDRECVDIKYFTPDQYCLRVFKIIHEEPQQIAVTPSEESAEQNSAETQLAQPSKKERKLYGEKKSNEVSGIRRGTVFFMSFLGAIFGSGVVAAITAVLLKFAI
ncbi:MAG: hypothetical protein K2J16_05250 [Clostridia bacterium]|nr:hypothetical protein [Clostridia bacterium]